MADNISENPSEMPLPDNLPLFTTVYNHLTDKMEASIREIIVSAKPEYRERLVEIPKLVLEEQPSDIVLFLAEHFRHKLQLENEKIKAEKEKKDVERKKQFEKDLLEAIKEKEKKVKEALDSVHSKENKLKADEEAKRKKIEGDLREGRWVPCPDNEWETEPDVYEYTWKKETVTKEMVENAIKNNRREPTSPVNSITELWLNEIVAKEEKVNEPTKNAFKLFQKRRTEKIDKINNNIKTNKIDPVRAAVVIPVEGEFEKKMRRKTVEADRKKSEDERACHAKLIVILSIILTIAVTVGIIAIIIDLMYYDCYPGGKDYDGPHCIDCSPGGKDYDDLVCLDCTPGGKDFNTTKC